jgi:ABC-type polar amino acid transport system ATPase subunit
MTTHPVLEFDSVVKRFGTRTILDGVSLDVTAGEIVCFIGSSGTGKSTLLRCVNGLEAIQGGQIRFDGVPMQSTTAGLIAVRKRVGMIFQHFNLYPHLTALQNVMLAPVVVHGEERRAVEARARARALACNPDLLMFDEPTSALDPETVGDVLGVMRDLAAEGRTMLVVTHEIRFAADVGTRMVFMDKGRIVEQGDPRAMLAAPQTERARQFLSSIAA